MKQARARIAMLQTQIEKMNAMADEQATLRSSLERRLRNLEVQRAEMRKKEQILELTKSKSMKAMDEYSRRIESKTAATLDAMEADFQKRLRQELQKQREHLKATMTCKGGAWCVRLICDEEQLKKLAPVTPGHASTDSSVFEGCVYEPQNSDASRVQHPTGMLSTFSEDLPSVAEIQDPEHSKSEAKTSQ
ncbi:hypothetical protein CYMTET_16866 [Cymbomonas tetramitiformis]|uniref:Uncharacterized protein n=1 Tax=Cymbomonas tetramitiformis TaxID=36881 RepID=A0AAE0GCJ8_9CHLO|nr:hypothetical protein CYMTET_16866 [Cymbomonas tetramitiformis]